jgi:hypothetical protein
MTGDEFLEILEKMTSKQRARPLPAAYPNPRAEVPIVTTNIWWNAKERRLEIDSDNWSG